MPFPKLVHRAAAYSFMSHAEAHHVPAETGLAEFNRLHMTNLKYPLSLHSIEHIETDMLGTVEVDAFSSVKLQGNIDFAYCKLGKYSTCNIKAPSQNIVPRRVCSVIGKDCCCVSLLLYSDYNYVTSVPSNSYDKDVIKQRKDCSISGFSFSGDMFRLRFEVGMYRAYLSMEVFAGDLEIHYQGEHLTTCPQGFVYEKYIRPEQHWQYELKRAVREFIKSGREV